MVPTHNFLKKTNVSQCVYSRQRTLKQINEQYLQKIFHDSPEPVDTREAIIRYPPPRAALSLYEHSRGEVRQPPPQIRRQVPQAKCRKEYLYLHIRPTFCKCVSSSVVGDSQNELVETLPSSFK